jgi:hypothetical protein
MAAFKWHIAREHPTGTPHDLLHRRELDLGRFHDRILIDIRLTTGRG